MIPKRRTPPRRLHEREGEIRPGLGAQTQLEFSAGRSVRLPRPERKLSTFISFEEWLGCWRRAMGSEEFCRELNREARQ